MLKSKMEEVAKLLGINYEQEFFIANSPNNPYKILDVGLINANNQICNDELIFILCGVLSIGTEFKPRMGELYFLPMPTGKVEKFTWRNTDYDKKVLKNVGVFITKKEAYDKGVSLGWEMEDIYE